MKAPLVALFLSLTLSSAAHAGDSEILKQAQDAYVKANYTRAVELAQKGIDEEPLRAWRILASSHCYLKDKAKVQEAFAKLDKPGQQYVRYVCKRQGITIE